MESIEADYENLRGVLPKWEYQEFDNAVFGQLLRTLNPEELKKASGDVFGRIYEYSSPSSLTTRPMTTANFSRPSRWSR